MISSEKEKKLLSSSWLTDEMRTKYSLLKETYTKFSPQQDNKEYSLEINLVEVPFQLSFQGPFKEDALSFAKNYYSRFLSENQRSHRIIFQTLEAPFNELTHQLYSAKLPYSHFQKISEDEYIEFDRDYISLINLKEDFSFVVGPTPSQGNPDSLDNLLSSRFASYFKKHQCLIQHCSAVKIDDYAVMFFGPSGAGKSTIAHLLYEREGLKVIGSDQCYLRLIQDQLLIQSTSITIPELVDAPDEAREWNPLPVKGIFYLNKNLRPRGITECSGIDLMKPFLQEASHYLTPFSDEQAFLEVVSKTLSKNSIKFGYLSYHKDDSPLSHILDVLK